MKTVLITSEMTIKQRNTICYEVFSETEDDESFKIIEEMSPERLRDAMQVSLDVLQKYSEIKVKIEKVTFDHERNLIIIEQLFGPQPKEED